MQHFRDIPILNVQQAIALVEQAKQ